MSYLSAVVSRICLGAVTRAHEADGDDLPAVVGCDECVLFDDVRSGAETPGTEPEPPPQGEQPGHLADRGLEHAEGVGVVEPRRERPGHVRGPGPVTQAAGDQGVEGDFVSHATGEPDEVLPCERLEELPGD